MTSSYETFNEEYGFIGEIFNPSICSQYGLSITLPSLLFIVSRDCCYWQYWVQVTIRFHSWWRHQMDTFSALLALCAGTSLVIGEFPSQRPVTRSFDVSFDLRLNKRLSKQSRPRWFETPWHPSWRHCNVPSSWSRCVRLWGSVIKYLI